jgi:hypothetical protein
MGSAKQAAQWFMLLFIIAACIWYAAGCGSITSVRPVGQGRQSLSLAVGGPFADYFGGSKPIPYGLLRYRRGLSEKTDLYASLHLTPAIFGIVGLDGGLAKQFLAQKGSRPAVNIGGGINFFMLAYDTSHAFKPEISSFRAYPQLFIIGSYALKQHLVYFGADNMFQLSNPYLISVLVLGGEYRWSRLFRTTLEARWYAPWENSVFRTVNYTAPIQKHGDVGIILGFNFYL